MYRAFGQPRAALALFRETFRLNQHSRHALTELGYNFDELGDERANLFYWKAIAADTSVGSVPYNLSLNLHRAG